MKILNLPKRLVLIAFMAACSLTGFGQQEPMFTQYVFNMQTVNPAYAGTWQTIGFTALARLQWVGIEGNPTTQTFSMQTPFRSENVGLGLNIVNDEIGLEQRLMFNIDYSYRLRISRESSLRLGIKGGFTNYSNPLGFYTTYPGEESDPNFQGYVDNQFMPNVGIGAFLSSDKYYLGLSIPKLVETTFKTTEDEYTTLQEMRQYFLIGGVVFDLSRYVKFKPTVFTRAVVGAPIQYDISANFLFNEKFWLGAMYRSGDALGVIAQWIIKDRFRIGYAYDFTITDLSNYQSGTHEIMVSYEIDWKRFVSPRYF
jgi:type IX secretion system PorP/SprF family membrane protein